MNIYNISKGQLITVWVFGILGWLSSVGRYLDSWSSDAFAGCLVLLIPAALIFYTIGWRNNSKKSKK